MKRSISVTALALTVSTPSFALMMPPVKTKTLCLDTFEDAEGSKYAGNCNQSANNTALELPILANGCAEGQIALTSVAYPAPKKSGKKGVKFDIEIKNCLPPNVAQL